MAVQTIEQTVVIPSSGDVLRLEWTLAGLARQVGAPRFEVVVCADVMAEKLPLLQDLVGDNDFGLSLRLVHLPVKESEEEFRAGSARNLGIVHAAGEQCVFLDEDCVPDPDFCAAHWENKDAAVIGLRRDLSEALVTEFPGEIDDQFFGMYCTFDYRHGRDQAYPADWISCNASAPKAVLMEIGGFDEEFSGQWGSEDIQLGCRMRDHGAVEFVILKEAGWVTHLGHKRRSARPDNRERIMAAIRGEYPVVTSGGALVPA